VVREALDTQCDIDRSQISDLQYMLLSENIPNVSHWSGCLVIIITRSLAVAG